MALMKCPECGKEISNLAKNCPNCGFPIGFEIGKESENRTQYQQNNTYQPNMTPAQPIRAYIHEPEKNSGLGIAAFILSILGVTFFIGIILAIIDLCRKDGKKKILSIVSLCICAFWVILAVSVSGNDSEDKQASVSVESQNVIQDSVDDTEKETAKKETKEIKEEKSNISDEYINITSTELIDAYNENQVKCKQTYDGKMIKVTGKVDSVGTDILGTTYVCLGHDTEYTFVGVQCYAKDNETTNQIAELKADDLIVVTGKGECGSLSFSIKDAEIVEILEESNDSYVDDNGEVIDDLTAGQSNALKQAKSYLDFSAFSYQGLIEQLEYEKYSHEDAVFAADNCGADWNEQAVEKAKSYLEFSSFSKEGLIEQLEYEGFTHEQAVYGAEANGY